jgi:MscS family membrane protein
MRHSQPIFSLLLLLFVATANAGHPLAPIDTSSPRATISSFLTLTEEAADRYEEFRDTPNPETQAALWQISVTAERLLDLSQVPPATRAKVADETFYLLWEVMARLEIPDLQEIPGASADQSTELKEVQAKRWRIPNSEIIIARVMEGPYAGEYLFSPDTVKNARRYYETMRELPYVRPIQVENVYRINELITGWMIPLKWTEKLPNWASYAVFGQVVWKWLAILLLFGIVIAAVLFIFKWTQRKTPDSSFLKYLRHLSTPLVILILAQLTGFFATYQINVTGFAVGLPDIFREIANGIAAVWLVWLSAHWIAETIVSSPNINPKSLKANVIRLAARFIGFLAVFVLIFRVAHDIGIPVYGLVAGAGVSGLAIALAAKNTLENFMGTINLFADRPVQVGDLCRYDEETAQGWRPVGRVEAIGLRSTKIRRIDRTLITIPNAEFSQKNIVNLSACDRMLFTTTLGLRYETSDDQLRYVLVELRKLLHGHPMAIHTSDDPIRVRFTGFGDYSLNVAIRAYIRTRNFNEFLAIQEDLLLRMFSIIEQAGTGFAFPSRTLYHTRDGGLDEEKQQSAEKQVREWSAAYELPFPEFSDEQRKAFANTLDYPPEGSPDADRG